MATHSSVLAWRIPGTGEPGGQPSMGSHRVGLKLLSSSSSSIVKREKKKALYLCNLCVKSMCDKLVHQTLMQGERVLSPTWSGVVQTLWLSPKQQVLSILSTGRVDV